jgi:hypothetical protein
MNNNNYEMTINNKTIYDFYEKNKSLNFEEVSLLCVGLFENILQDANATLNNSITSQILKECLENNHKLNELSNEMHNINNNISKLNHELVIKFFDIKKEYIDEVKTIMNTQLRENSDNFKELIERGNTQLLDKSALLNHSLVTDVTERFDDKNPGLMTRPLSQHHKNFHASCFLI